MGGVVHGLIASLAGAVKDTFFKYVTLLLNTTSTNGAQNNTFLDASTNNFTITRNGDTTQGSFNPYMPSGYWSGFFDGNGDNLSVADNAALNMGASDFTLEGWIYVTATPTAVSPYGGVILDKDGLSGVSWSQYAISVGSTRKLIFQANSVPNTFSPAATITGATTLALNTWYHFAVTRVGVNATLWLNGVSDGTTASVPATLNNGARALLIGWTNRGSPDASFNFPGYISNVRIVKGTAVYTSAFTPPTTPLTAITNTSLLACQSNRFIDNSTNSFAITVNGDSRISKFSPFSPPASYSTATYGGSGYFDGTGDYLTAPSNTNLSLSTSVVDFTIEAWVYPIAFGGALTTIVALWPQTTGQDQYIFSSTTSGVLEFYWAPFNTSTVFISGGTLPRNIWSHVAVTRSGNTFRIFLNGTQTATGTSTGTTGANNVTSIGRFGDGLTGSSPTSYWNGYIVNCRIVKGTAVYTGAFTPPTDPVTAITNTSLLLNFTNAGIYDASTINDAQTVGNAQVSTTVAKFGTTSMAFDGAGDWLTIIDKPELRFGTAPFTIEGWVYLGATGAARGIAAKGTSTTGWLLSTDASNKVVFTYTTSTITSTAALSGSTWYHIAVVREGTGSNQTKIYIDGTNDGTGTVSTDFNQTSVMYVGANRTGGDALNGYIDELRITNGYARYTANFTPPTAAFPTL